MIEALMNMNQQELFLLGRTIAVGYSIINNRHSRFQDTITSTKENVLGPNMSSNSNNWYQELLVKNMSDRQSVMGEIRKICPSFRDSHELASLGLEF